MCNVSIKTLNMKQIVGIEIILYVHDQKRSTEFYTALFRRKPHINVPGMTEFILSDRCKLGLMPHDGIVKILKDFMPHPDRGNGIPRCELYLRTNGVTAEYDNALQIGASSSVLLKVRTGEMMSAAFPFPMHRFFLTLIFNRLIIITTQLVL